MADIDPNLPNDPNTQAYKFDFLAGKFASPTVENTPEHFGSVITPQQEAGFQNPNTNFVYAGISNDLDDNSPLSRENSLRDRQFESQFGSNVIQPHFDAATANESYHALAARHTRLLNHAHTRADSADYLRHSGQLDPTSETALEEHINNKTLFPGALGDDVDASDQHFANIYNQHQRATGQGWNTVQNDIKAGHITNDQIKRLPDGSVDYYSTHMLANEQGGSQAIQKQENAPENRLNNAYKNLQALNAEGVKPEKGDEGYIEWRARVKFLHDQIDSAQAQLTAAKAKTTPISATPKGPSQEFLDAQNRFKTPGQIESLKNPNAVAPNKTTAITSKPETVNQGGRTYDLQPEGSYKQR